MGWLSWERHCQHTSRQQELHPWRWKEGTGSSDFCVVGGVHILPSTSIHAMKTLITVKPFKEKVIENLQDLFGEGSS